MEPLVRCNIIYNNDKCLTKGTNINYSNVSCIINNKLICYNSEQLFIKDIITSETITKNIVFDHLHIKKILASDDLKYIFILYSKKIENFRSKFIVRINLNEDNPTLVHFNFDDEIYNMYMFNNNIILSFIDKKEIKIIDYDGHIIVSYGGIYIINITNSDNYIILSNMVSFAPHKTNLTIIKLDNNRIVHINNFINKSCGLFSKDETIFYLYDDYKELLYIYNCDDWSIINIVSIKMNEGSYWYKNNHFNHMCLMPDNKHMIFSNYKTSELWNITTGKYIGTFDIINSKYKLSFDNLYLIGINDSSYHVWDINYGKFLYYKTQTKYNLPNELWKMIEDYIN